MLTAMTAPHASTVELTIEGMHCGSCVALIEETWTEMPGVERATVDLDRATASITFDEGTIGAGELAEIVTDVGYPATLAPTGG